MWPASNSLTSKPGTPRGPGKPLAPGFPWMGKKQSNECAKANVVFMHVFLAMSGVALGMAILACWLVGPPLWSKLKYLNNC